MSLFGNTGAAAAQTQSSGGLFGSLNPNTAQNQPGGGLFGGQNKPSSIGIFGNTSQAQNQQTGGTGLFGASTAQPAQSTSIFGQSTQNNQQATGGTGIFGSAPQNQTQGQGGLFGVSQQQQALGQSQPQLGSSLFVPNSNVGPREKSVPEQIVLVLEKWDTNNPSCAFKYYFYNKVGENMAPYYRPAPNEDSKAWEDALSKKPGPGLIPVLCTGFQQMGERIKTQQRFIAAYNKRLHEINDSLTRILQTHDTSTSIRAMNAKRRHLALKNRCLALATKVQTLRNRGYALGGDEEDLKRKLQILEASVCDPSLGARAEEVWARMISVQERARLLQREFERSGMESNTTLDDEMIRRAKKILEDYQTQLVHLKRELDSIQADFVAWENEQGPPLKKQSAQ